MSRAAPVVALHLVSGAGQDFSTWWHPSFPAKGQHDLLDGWRGTTLPVDPLLFRPQWPTMSADEGIATIQRLGREILPALAAIEPLTAMPA